MTAREIRKMFLARLPGMYDAREIQEIFYILLDELAQVNRTGFHLEPGTELDRKKTELLMDALEKLKEGWPVQYITGKADFNGLVINVTRDVLIPRQETAEMAVLVECGLKTSEKRNFRILDIGTGSGCIAIYLKKRFPESEVYGLDVSKKALKTAAGNAVMHGTKISFIHGDILNPEAGSLLPSADIVVSNPPYVRESEKIDMKVQVTGFEPPSALYVSDSDPLQFVRAVTDGALICLRRPGVLFMEINECTGGEVVSFLGSKGFFPTEVIRDLAGKDRFIRAELRK